MTVPLVERYRDRLPLAPGTEVVSLAEGSTPLLPAPRVSERLGAEVWLKWEGANPTGSFKDRGMTVAVSQALADGADWVVCASTGNTAASAAAYAARAGIQALILLPEGAVALGKLAQARAVGAVIEERADFEAALDEARKLDARGTHVLVNSLNPLRLEGQKTAAFEIVEELGAAPDVLAGEARDRAKTVASAIRIAEPAHAEAAERVVRDSGGAAIPVDDDAILAAWRLLARGEGLFCEPSSAAGLAALLADPPRDARVVCVITGHGLKDVEAVS